MAVVTKKNVLPVAVASLLAMMLILLPPAPALGVVVSDLYQARVAVSGESDEALSDGYRRGLEQVLVRVSGDRDIAERGELGQTLEEAKSLVDTWQVESGDDGDDQLRMQFSRQRVNQALADAGAPVWGANRPLTLAWVAVQDGGDRGLLVETGDASGQDLSAELRRAARERGLPLALPPADRATDRRLLSEVWGQFMGQLAQASSGLDHDLLAVVRVTRRNGGWQASWVYEGAGIEQSRSVSADTEEALARELTDAWAEELASRYAVTGGDVQTGPRVRLVVEGVDSPAKYAGAKRALSQLNPVESVGAVEVSRDRIVFLVEHRGEVEQLQQNLALDERFRVVEGQPRQSRDADDDQRENRFETVEQTLYYRWQEQVISPSGGDDR